jgi:hypothetical protein
MARCTFKNPPYWPRTGRGTRQVGSAGLKQTPSHASVSSEPTSSVPPHLLIFDNENIFMYELEPRM